MKLAETAIGQITGAGYCGLGALLFTVSCLLYFSLSWFIKSPICQSKASLSGKTVIITGATSGLGREAALELSLRGARVILVCRDVVKGHDVAGEIKSETQGELQVEQCELSSLNSVRQFAARMLETESRVDILINCAGVKNTPHWKTQDGFEYQLGVNYLSHFLLTWLLLPVIKRVGEGARIVNVSCSQHRNVRFDPDNLFSEPEKYKAKFAYGRSKLYLNLFSVELARRLEATGVNVMTANPGLTNTQLGRHRRQDSIMAAATTFFHWPWLRTPNNGVQTILYCALDESLEDQTGLYYENCSIALPSPDSESAANGLQLWRVTERLVGIS